MVGDARYRKDLFRGTGEYYARFRPPFPVALVEELRRRAPLDETSRVLDLACGTGHVAFAVAPYVAEVWAVDQEPELIDVGRRQAAQLGVDNIRWSVATAEQVVLDQTVDLVTIGNAFHRLDRDAVARRLVSRLAPGGAVALLWSGTIWGGDQPWQRAVHVTLERWRDATGERDRVPEGWEQVIEQDPHAQVLRRAGLAYEGIFECSVAKRWSFEELVGFVYSTSFLNRAVLGSQAVAFERDLSQQLDDSGADGVFDQDLSFECELARRVG